MNEGRELIQRLVHRDGAWAGFDISPDFHRLRNKTFETGVEQIKFLYLGRIQLCQFREYANSYQGDIHRLSEKECKTHKRAQFYGMEIIEVNEEYFMEMGS